MEERVAVLQEYFSSCGRPAPCAPKKLTVAHYTAFSPCYRYAAADLVAKLDGKAEIVRMLAYRLYTVCERKKRAHEALSYNGLVQSWPEIIRLAREDGKMQHSQAEIFEPAISHGHN